MPRAERLALLAAIAIAVVGALVAASAPRSPVAQACCRFEGVSFGMTDAQIREGFVEARDGAWTRRKDGGVDVLEWARRTPSELAPERVRFELHAGFLTGIRARLGARSDLAKGAAFDSTSMSVTVRRPLDDGAVEYVSLVRDCTDHAPEVATLLADHARAVGQPASAGSLSTESITK